jgi:hypothetical protein
MQPVFSQCLLSLAVAGSLCWFVTSSLWIYPHSLSYFNESIGGPLNGPQHLLGSNVDWGQDLRYVRWTGHGDSTFAYYGMFDPRNLGFSVVGDHPNSRNISVLPDRQFPGTLVISVMLLAAPERAPLHTDKVALSDLLHKSKGQFKILGHITYAIVSITTD